MREDREMGIIDNRATEASRGVQSERWEVERVLRRGYATVTAYYGDLEPDHADGQSQGVRPSFKPAATELGGEDMPPLNQPVGDFIGYHIRPGIHGVFVYDWEQFLNFADKHLQPTR